MSFIIGLGVSQNPQAYPPYVTANSAGPYVTGNAYTWTITPTDSYVTYSVATTNGSVSLVGTTITYTPATAGNAGFSVNSRGVNITAIAPTVPDAPTVGTVTVVGLTATVPFTAPAFNGYSTILSYTATSNPGGITGTVTQSGSGSITVSGLSPLTSYTFTVTATNAVGTSAPSAASNSVTTGAAPGQQEYTTAGTYSWVAPTGVTSVCAVAVGPGRNGAGGGLGWKNNIPVVPGNSYTVVVGAAGSTTDSYFNSSVTVQGNSGATRTYVGDGGGNGGTAGARSGGGAGGYSGNGGNGASAFSGPANGNAGSGGGGGSGAVEGASSCASFGGAGGGVGLLGQGSNGAAGIGTGGSSAAGGGGGSGGANGGSTTLAVEGVGGAYGGGGGLSAAVGGRPSGVGAVRIIWGSGRAFPSTNTGNL